MRDIFVTISPDSTACVRGEAGFVEEHNAARLVIELNEVLSASDISYYVICFDIYGLGRKIVSNNIYGNVGDSPAYKSGNTLFCPLPEVLTSTGELLVQVEAHKAADGEVIRIVKSGMFALQFEPSITGCDDSLTDACGLLPKLQAALAGLETVSRNIVLCTPAKYSLIKNKIPSTFYLVDDKGLPEDDEPDTPLPVAGLSLNKSALSILAGSTEALTAAVTPENAANKTVLWASSNAQVAAVNQYGLVTGIGAGYAIISAVTQDGSFTACCSVTVTVQAIAVTGIILNKASMSLIRGSSETLTAAISPASATNKAVSWASSNTAVATVNAAGVVTSVGAGIAVITAVSEDGSFTASCTVAVTASLGLWQGAKTVNGITAVISGNHILLSGTKTTANYPAGTVYYTDNISDVANFASCPNWYAFKAGDTITLTVKNITGSCSESGANSANACCQLRNSANTVLCGSTWGSPAGAFTYTFPSDTAVIGLFCYLTVGAVLTNFAFDVEFSVNGTRWI